MNALERNTTWKIVDKPKEKRVESGNGQLQWNIRHMGLQTHIKSDLVPKGYIEAYGIDTEKTFTLVAKINTI